MYTGLPGDPVILLSVVNTKLRDFYPSLEALCEDMQADQKEITDKLRCARICRRIRRRSRIS